MQTIMSLVGMLTVFGLALLMSSDRSAINRRTIGIAFLLQVAIGALVMFVPLGRMLLDRVVRGVKYVIDFGKEGVAFVFGDKFGDALGFTIALNVLPIIVFFAALMSVLYYLGVMQFVVGTLGGCIRRLLGTSHAESVSAVSNIFVGHTDAPLVVRPYLEKMTHSELFAVMTGGCATIAGAVMMGYAEMGVDLRYLITASFMAAPGGLLIAKVLYPETEPHDDVRLEDVPDEERPVNIFEAIGNGAMTGLQVALSVGAMLIAFVGLVYLVNGILSLVGGWIGFEQLTLQWLLGWVFAPVAWLLGVPSGEATLAGSLIGQKLVLNEFYAYVSFVGVRESLSEYTQVVVTFALCGFSNLASIAILLGGLGAIVPTRRHDIARFGLRAVIGGTLVNLMNAAIAGFFFSLQ